MTFTSPVSFHSSKRTAASTLPRPAHTYSRIGPLQSSADSSFSESLTFVDSFLLRVSRIGVDK